MSLALWQQNICVVFEDDNKIMNFVYFRGQGIIIMENFVTVPMASLLGCVYTREATKKKISGFDLQKWPRAKQLNFIMGFCQK